MRENASENERKRLLVSVKSKQKNSKWPSVKGKDHRFSLLLVRGFWRNEPSVLSVCLENFTEERVKKIAGRKKIDSRATLMQPEEFR